MRVIWEEVRFALGEEVCLGGAAAMARELWPVVEGLAFVVVGGHVGRAHGRPAVLGEKEVERAGPGFAGLGEIGAVLAEEEEEKLTAHSELAEFDSVALLDVAFAEQMSVPAEQEKAGLARQWETVLTDQRQSNWK